MAKKRKGRLVPIKKTVFDPRVGKSIERTYYINPDKSKKSGKLAPKSNKETKQEGGIDINKYAQKLAFCNW